MLQSHMAGQTAFFFLCGSGEKSGLAMQDQQRETTVNDALHDIIIVKVVILGSD